MKEKKNRLSKLSIVAFVIVSFCVVSVSNQSSQAQTLALSGDTSFIGVIWEYLFPSIDTIESTPKSDEPVPMRTPDEGPGGGTPTPTPIPDPLCNRFNRLGC
jgi:hypothetical protein